MRDDDRDGVTDLPSSLVRRFCEAVYDDDEERLERLRGRAARAGADLLPELLATWEVVLDPPPGLDAGLARYGLSLAAEATHHPPAMALALRDIVHVEPGTLELEVEELLAEDREGWVEAARLLLPSARAEDDDALVELCCELLSFADLEEVAARDALLDALASHPTFAAPAIAALDDPAAGPRLLRWLRSAPPPDESDRAASEAYFEAGTALHDWGIALEPAELARVNRAGEAVRAHLEAEVERLRDARIAAEHLLARRYPDLDPESSRRRRRLDRRLQGPNAACDCGSGLKRKHCCG